VWVFRNEGLRPESVVIWPISQICLETDAVISSRWSGDAVLIWCADSPTPPLAERFGIEDAKRICKWMRQCNTGGKGDTKTRRADRFEYTLYG